MDTFPPLPRGFLAAGGHVGIKNSKPDLGVLVSSRPAAFWATLTRNRSRAHCVDRSQALRQGGGPVRGIIVCSGNANALTGPQGREDDAQMAAALAAALGVQPQEVLTASTGVIGHPLPLAKITAGLPGLMPTLAASPERFAHSVLTTDRVPKVFARDLFVEGQPLHLHAVVKGAGMIAPELATLLCFVTTDAVVSQSALRLALETAVEATFNQLSVDGDTSTNDGVFLLANGAAKGSPVEVGSAAFDIFVKALIELLEDAARGIARDGEGATRLLVASVRGAATRAEAQALSRAVVDSLLVKAAVFGQDPYAWGRVISALGAAAAARGASFELDRLRLALQGVDVFVDGAPRQLPSDLHGLKHRMGEPEVHVDVDLGLGDASGRAWGCDLTYDYVKINADYAAVTQTSADGSVRVDERLSELGPSLKKRLLIEGLRYIERFRGTHAVIKLGGAAMVDPTLETVFAEDVLLLASLGLKPVIVHGGGPEISRTLKHLGQESRFVNGLRITGPETMGVIEMVLTGKVNQGLVAALNRSGGRAVGLSGKDGALMRARQHPDEALLGRVGEVERVDKTLITLLENEGYIPVISPVGLGPDGSAYNVNADSAAAAIAVALEAEKIIFLSDVPGLLEGDALVSELVSDTLRFKLEEGVVTGGMVPKLEAALHALRGGVACAHLVDGRVPHNLIAELFTDRGVGTLVRRG